MVENLSPKEQDLNDHPKVLVAIVTESPEGYGVHAEMPSREDKKGYPPREIASIAAMAINSIMQGSIRAMGSAGVEPELANALMQASIIAYSDEPNESTFEASTRERPKE